MWVFFSCLAIGLFIGWRGLLPQRLLPLTDKVTLGGLFLLLFTMGAKIGTDPVVLANLGTLGWQALALAAAAVAGSVVCLGLLEKGLLKTLLPAKETSR